MDNYTKFQAKCFAELEYLKEKKKSQENRERILALLDPEKKDELDKLIRKIEELAQEVGVNLSVGKSGRDREKFIKEFCDEFVPLP